MIIDNIFLLWMRLLLLGTSIYVFVNWILNACKAESAIEYSSTIVFVSLSKTWILMQLSQYFIQSGHRSWLLQLILDSSLGGTIILAHLSHHYSVVVRVIIIVILSASLHVRNVILLHLNFTHWNVSCKFSWILLF